MDTKATCFVRLCRNPSASKSPISDQPLCEHHLQADLRRCENAEAAVADRIAHFRNYQRPLRLMQQRLASDMELLCDTFQDLRDSFEKCQAELTEAVNKHYEKMSESLATLAVVDELETEFRTAKNERNLRQAFLITENMDKSLESLELNSELVCMNEGKTEVTMAAFPDVNSMVRNLQMSFDMSLQLAQNLVKSLDIRASKSQSVPNTDAVPKQNNIQLSGTPSCLTVWNSTEGFALDGSGSIVGAKTATGGCKSRTKCVPQPGSEDIKYLSQLLKSPKHLRQLLKRPKCLKYVSCLPNPFLSPWIVLPARKMSFWFHSTLRRSARYPAAGSSPSETFTPTQNCNCCSSSKIYS
ncbi:hypothetical protein BOX15_Mlig034535g3 [Macrostomum lignano]|uniref:Uncharacterized protein n=1 Tax=Macrostomum lignano TaxID=282301 RepID=A0A267DRJ7_9PLAT|nr:hypothetical protein BOX15_Mlig034535g3 [Macrostomum lignano]